MVWRWPPQRWPLRHRFVTEVVTEHICLATPKAAQRPPSKRPSADPHLCCVRRAERAKVHEIEVPTIQSYIDAFKYGCAPHGGIGVGLERVVMLFCALGNIRLTSMYAPPSRTWIARKPLVATELFASVAYKRDSAPVGLWGHDALGLAVHS